MSDHVSKHSNEEETTSRASSLGPQPSWTSHWIKGKSKATSTVDSKSCLSPSLLKMESGPSQSGIEMYTGAGKLLRGNVTRKLADKALDLENKFSNSPFPTLRLGQNTDTNTISPQADHDSSHETMSLALVLGKKATPIELNFLQERKHGGSEKLGMSYLCEEQKGGAVSRPCAINQAGSTSSALPQPTKPVKVFERHFSNDNFTCFDQDDCKYQKYKNMSSALRQKDGLHVQHDQSANKNFQALFQQQHSRAVQRHANDAVFDTHGSLSNIDQAKSYHGFHQPDRFPCSLHNVETMRICTLVDSVENSSGGPHKISHRSHHLLLTKETTCANLSKYHILGNTSTCPQYEERTYRRPFYVSPAHRRGVQIQSLSPSTESEAKENAGVSISKAGSRNEGSAETDGMQVDAPDNQDIQLGVASSLLQKNGVHEDSSSAASDSNKVKTGRKRPLVEIPDINEELPGLQPELSSTDGRESNTSRVHSLDAKQLSPSGEQASKSESNQNCPVTLEAGSRWIKRLKLNTSDSVGVGTKSSDVREGSSREKFNTFFNRIMKCGREDSDPEVGRYLSEQQVALIQDVELLKNDGSSYMVPKKKSQNLMQGCSWIQRWSQHSAASLTKNPDPLVICEPHRLKFGQDDDSKKQFPSIGALALMGKAMNGFRSCEFKKRGSVTVWNTKEF